MAWFNRFPGAKAPIIKREFYECDCHSEGVRMQYDEELPLAELGFFQYGFGARVLSFRDRIRCAWQVLRTGYPFADTVILSQEEASRLGRDLLIFGTRDYSPKEEK